MKDKRGVTIIEVIIGVFLVGVITTSVYAIFVQTIGIMADAKQRMGAIALSTERIEYYRNFSYENIPIIDPPNVASIERSGFTYDIETSVIMIDDFENGVNGEGDYKQLRVKVSWMNRGKERNVYFANNFSSTGIAHGTIFINTYDSNSYAPLSGALVELTEISSGLKASQLTDDENGNVLFYGVDGDNKEYQAVISKNGYGTLNTYDASGTSLPFDPIYKNILLTNENDSALRYFSLSRTSNLVVSAIDEEGDGISSVEVELFGGQKTGNDPDTYSYDDTGNPQETDASGNIDYKNNENLDLKMNPGNYRLANIDTVGKSGYEFIGVEDGKYPFALSAGISDTMKLIFVDELKNSLLVKIKDDSDNAPVQDASVRLQNTDIDYDRTVLSDSLGFAFFRFDEGDVFEELIAGDYDIEINADGYYDQSVTTTVSAFTLEEIMLTLIE